MRISVEDKKHLEEQYPKVIISLEDTILDLNLLLQRLQEPKAKENLNHGVMRRGFVNAHCLRRIYKISPPTRTQHLTHEEREDLTAFLLTLLFNNSGIIDNLSWIWFYEKKIYKNEDPNAFKFSVNLFNKKFKKYLHDNIINKLGKFKEWQEYLKNFRDPIAHRIPPYIIPYFVNNDGLKKYRELEKQFYTETDLDKRDEILYKMDTLGVYEPTYVHSYSEDSPLVAMHPQVLADTNTIIEIIKIIKENL